MTEAEPISITEMFDALLRPWNIIHDTITDSFGIPDIFVTMGMFLVIIWFARRIFRLFDIFDVDFYWLKRMTKPRKRSRSTNTKQKEVSLPQKFLSSLGLVKIKRVE